MGSICLERHILVFLTVSAFAVAQSTVLTKWQVNVRNELDGGKNLTIQCKSKDNDLGERSLGFGQIYNIKFRVNLWATTRFWCYLSRPDNYEATFDVFWVEKKTMWLRVSCDDNICNWVVKDHGISLEDNSAKTSQLVHTWKPKPTK